MEKGGSSNIEHKYIRRARTSGIVITEGDAPPPAASTTTNAANITSPPNAAAGEVSLEQQQGFKRDADQYMPIANIICIMRSILPAHAKIADDAKEVIQECISEFISFIAVEANGRCHREYRKTITPEDVLAAMASLGFNNYLEPLTIFLNKHRAQKDSDRSSMNPLPQFVRRSGAADGGSGFVQYQEPQGSHMVRHLPPTPPPPPVAPTTGYYVPLPPVAATTMEEEEEFGELTTTVNDYIFGNHGGGEGSSGCREFDLFQKFKLMCITIIMD
ncbi:hypothetical protein ABFX02_11G081900 [Erythranthe guttata]